MEFQEILKRRTVRFFEQRPLPDAELHRLIDAARLASSGANNQPLRYLVIRTPERVAAIFAHTRYGGRVTPRRNPTPGRTAPVAFIAVVTDGRADRALVQADAGAAIQSLEFAAWERGIGCCWIGSFDRPEVEELLTLPAGTSAVYLVALGYPAETPVLEDTPAGGEAGYYLDDADTLHVRKFTVEAITRWL